MYILKTPAFLKKNLINSGFVKRKKRRVKNLIIRFLQILLNFTQSRKIQNMFTFF